MDLSAYHTRGFQRVPIFTPAEVSVLAADVDHLSARLPDTAAWAGSWIKDFGLDKPHTLKASHGIHQQSSSWLEATQHPGLMAVVTAILGPAELKEATMVVKPPETGQPFPVHQDAVYYGHGTTSVLAVVHLDTTTPENGPLRFLEGEHTKGLLPHVRPGGGKWHLDRQQYPVERTTEVCADAGDVVFFSLYTPHASYPNRSAKPRRTVRLWYVATGA